jgi:hypothetical protein
MKNRIPTFFFLALFLFLSLFAPAQALITGTVTDDAGQPLEGASVFAQNTTLGTLTKADGSYKLGLGKGGFELVVSFTGYVTQRFNIDAVADRTIDVKLLKEDKSLSEVVIMSSNEVADGWEKYGSFFVTQFLGATPNAKLTSLQNPEALKFFYYKRTDKLKVFAAEPLRILDSALGYTLQYSLDSFVYYYKSSISSYQGNCLYLPMEGDAAQQETWAKAREKAYYGSRLHFLRSYYDSTLKQDGFTVDILTTGSQTQFGRLKNPYDTAYYFADTSSEAVELYFPTKISVGYTRAKPDPDYLQQMGLPASMPHQYSYVEFRDAIAIQPNGYFSPQRVWVNEGYWSWKNVADSLPFDYAPSGKVNQNK